MSTFRRTRSAAVGGAVLAVAAAGCTDTSTAAPTALDRATGAVLADAADRLADALDDGDPCRALDEAEALEERARAAIGEGAAPEVVVAETIRVVDTIAATLACDDDGSEVAATGGPEPEQSGEDAEVESGDRDDAEPTETTDATAPDAAPSSSPASSGSSDTSAPSGGGPASGGGSASGGSTDGRNGPSAEPPRGAGQNRGGGQGRGEARGRG